MLIDVRLTVIKLSVAILNVVIVSVVGTVSPTTSSSNFFFDLILLKGLGARFIKPFLKRNKLACSTKNISTPV